MVRGSVVLSWEDYGNPITTIPHSIKDKTLVMYPQDSLSTQGRIIPLMLWATEEVAYTAFGMGDWNVANPPYACVIVSQDGIVTTDGETQLIWYALGDISYPLSSISDIWNYEIY